MTPPWLLPLILLLAVLVGSARLLWQQRGDQRMPAWRLLSLVVLQAGSAALLYLTLQPPPLPGQAGTLLVATAGSTAAQLQQQPGDIAIALPEAPALPGLERSPDLATALRRHPGMLRLQVVGDGLVPRDHDAARALPLRHTAPPPVRGLVGMQPPATVAPGDTFSVSAQVQGLRDASAELLDPAGQRVDRVAVGADGSLQLTGSARDAGYNTFTLRLLDAAGQPLAQVPVPLHVAASPATRVLILAGAPNPELKYLRRWASDAGLNLHTQITMGAGLQLGDAPVALNAQTLASFDLLLLDERSLAAMGTAQRSAVQQAVRAGLGVLVRAGGPLNDSARGALRGWGLDVRGGNDTAPLTLPGSQGDAAQLQARRGPSRGGALDGLETTADTAAGNDPPTAPVLQQIALRLRGTQWAALTRDHHGQPVGGWRSLGRGRVGLLPVTDSFRLVLAGRDERHAELWSEAFSSLARPTRSDAPPPRLPTIAWSGERTTLCQLPAGAGVIDTDGHSTVLRPDPAADGCAGYWPQRSGWHLLQHADQTEPFYVFDPTTAQSLYRHGLHQANQLLGQRTAPANANAAPTPRAGPRWPWLLGLLACIGLLWWLERRRSPAPPSGTTA